MLLIHGIALKTDISWEGGRRASVALTPPNLFPFKFVRLPMVLLKSHEDR